MIVQVDSKREICGKKFHDIRKDRAAGKILFPPRRPWLNLCLPAKGFQFRNLPFQSGNLAFALACRSSIFNRFRNHLEAVGSIFRKAVISRDRQKHPESFRVAFKAKLRFQVLNEFLVRGEYDKRELFWLCCARDGFSGDDGSGGGIGVVLHRSGLSKTQ